MRLLLCEARGPLHEMLLVRKEKNKKAQKSVVKGRRRSRQSRKHRGSHEDGGTEGIRRRNQGLKRENKTYVEGDRHDTLQRREKCLKNSRKKVPKNGRQENIGGIVDRGGERLIGWDYGQQKGRTQKEKRIIFIPFN